MTKKKSDIKPKLITEQTTAVIKGEVRTGRITRISEVWPETEEGAIASWLAAADSNTPRQQLNDQLDELEKHARVIKDDAIGRLDTGPMSTEYFCDTTLQQVSIVRGAISAYESQNQTEQQRGVFYTAMLQAVSLAHHYYLLAIKNNELAIMRRGPEETYNHGTPITKQLEGVKRVQKLIAQGKSKTAAIKQVADENGVVKTTVFNWMKKIEK